MTEYEPREHASASSIDLRNRCHRAWGYRYLEGRNLPELTWAPDMSGTPKQKSLALGKAVHAVLEEYYRGGSPNWGPRPGQIALAARQWLPAREDCDEVWPERAITLDTTKYNASIAKLEFQGYEDLVVRQGRNYFLFDYKSTKDFKWMKTPAEILADEQGCVYPLDIMDWAGTGCIPGRWVYTKTEGRPEARKVDVVFDRIPVEKQFRDLIIQAADLRYEVREYKKGQLKVLDLKPNPQECDSYGGCPYHKTRGGPCDGYGFADIDFSEVKVDLNETLTSLGWAPPIQPLGVAPVPYIPPPVVTQPLIVAVDPGVKDDGIYIPPAAVAKAYYVDLPTEPEPAPKKGRGRPKGAKNKSKVVETTGVCVEETVVGPAPGPVVQPDLTVANDVFVVRVASTHPLWETLNKLARVVQ